MEELFEIEKKIINLSNVDLGAFRNWFFEYDNKIWDNSFANYIENGKLDNLAEKALLQYQLGEFTEL